MAFATQWKPALLPVQGRQRDGGASAPRAVWRGSPSSQPPCPPVKPERPLGDATAPWGDAQRASQPPPPAALLPSPPPPPPRRQTARDTGVQPRGGEQPGARQGDVWTGPSPDGNTRQAEQGTRAENA